MFERTMEDAEATIHIESREAAMLFQYGVGEFTPGPHKLTYSAAAELVERMKRLANGVPRHLQARYRACMNGVRNAFGPEFWERH